MGREIRADSSLASQFPAALSRWMEKEWKDYLTPCVAG